MAKKAAGARHGRKRVVRAWGGFCDDKLGTWIEPCNLAIWKTRKEARARYEDVRRVEVRFR